MDEEKPPGGKPNGTGIQNARLRDREISEGGPGGMPASGRESVKQAGSFNGFF